MNSNTFEICTFGEILKSARISKSLTRKDAAQALDISPKTLVKYELMGVSDEGQFPSLPRLANMIAFYDIDPRYLFSSLINEGKGQRKVLQGAHLALNKTEPFMIEQLGVLSDAITDEIDDLDFEQDIVMVPIPNSLREEQALGNRQVIKREHRAVEKRREFLLSELRNIEEISLFSTITKINEPEDESLATASSGSKSTLPDQRKEVDDG